MQSGQGVNNIVHFLGENIIPTNRFNMRRVEISFRFNQFNTQTDDFESFLLLGFSQILNRATRGTSPNHLMGIKMNVISGDTTGPIGLSFKRVDQITPEMIHDLLFSVAQSNAAFAMSENLELTATIIERSVGGAWRINIKFLSDGQILRRKKECISDPGTSDEMLCLPMSLILGKVLADNNINLFNTLEYNKPKLIVEAKNLCKQAKVNVDRILGCDVLELYKFQKVLYDYSIAVYNDKTDGNKILFNVQNGGKPINLFFLVDMKHFILIKKLDSFFWL